MENREGPRVALTLGRLGQRQAAVGSESSPSAPPPGSRRSRLPGQPALRQGRRRRGLPQRQISRRRFAVSTAAAAPFASAGHRLLYPAPHLSTAAAVQTRWPFPSRRTPPLPPSMSSLPRCRALPFTRGGDLSGTISAGSGRSDRRRCFSDGATFCRGAPRRGGAHPSQAPRQSFAQAMIFAACAKIEDGGSMAMAAVPLVGQIGVFLARDILKEAGY